MFRCTKANQKQMTNIAPGGATVQKPDAARCFSPQTARYSRLRHVTTSTLLSTSKTNRPSQRPPIRARYDAPRLRFATPRYSSARRR